MTPGLLNIALRPMLQSPWREVARLYRQACWHSSQARDAEAKRILGGEFAEALAQANALAPLPNDQLLQALDAEADRVTTAAAMLELIGADAFRSSVSAPFREAVRSVPLRSERSNSDDLPGIADFIEDMLVQERDPR